SKLATFGDDDIANKVKVYLAERMPSNAEFEEKIPLHDFYGQFLDRAKCMLEAIEYKLTGNTEEKRVSDSDDVHLEHIMPQTITTKKSKEELGNWEKYLGDQAIEKHKDYVTKIGNMTLLSGVKNIVASNNPFESKKEIYKESDIKLTQELINYNSFGFDDVAARSKKLAEMSTKIWNF
ncbi:MAG: HNH endonuclease family protein, partial [Patescibacteria group bacterium]|nr:HNH endonuclease family protein [Patescibacteria group bacterium]